MRKGEIYGLEEKDVVFKADEINVAILRTKNGKDRNIKIVNTETIPAVDIMRRYKQITSSIGQRTYFLHGIKNNKAVRQRLGINRVAAHCEEVAKFLELSNPKSYSSHTNRRTSTTIMANNGATNVQLKSLGGWKNMKTVDGYIAENETMQRKTANTVLNLKDDRKRPSSTATSGAYEKLEGQKPAKCPNLHGKSLKIRPLIGISNTTLPTPMSAAATTTTPQDTLSVTDKAQTINLECPVTEVDNILSEIGVNSIVHTATNCKFIINITRK